MSTLTALSAISPIDGRYAEKTAALSSIFSEAGMIGRRTIVMLCWLIAVAPKLRPSAQFSQEDREEAVRCILQFFEPADAKRIKEIEGKTNHDVKAVEYWLLEQCATYPALNEVKGLLHFCCTSEDVNNLTHAMQLDAGRDALVDVIDEVIGELGTLVSNYRNVPMLSRTHGQPASPTTVGKELGNFHTRIVEARITFEAVMIYGKMNGAVGNYNAHSFVCPEVDWENLTRDLITGDGEFQFGFQFQLITTQIEPHDYMAEMFDALARLNTILIGFCRDMWGYISFDYFKLKPKEGEVGSSTMPHKVNPIDFENAEGNLGVANALLRHMSEKLPISRFQRDLTDSTVLRNMGVAFGHCLVAYQSILKGMGKLELNHEKLDADLEGAWQVLAEPVQLMMKYHGVEGAYDLLKSASRGKPVSKDDLHTLIRGLTIPDEEKERLLALTPQTYVGRASQLACIT